MLKTLLNSQLSSSATSPVYYDSPAVPSIGHIQLSLEIKGSQSSATSCLVRSFHLLTNDFILLVSSLETGVTWLLLSTLCLIPPSRNPEPKLTVDGPQETSKVTDDVASVQPTQLLLLDYGCFRRMMGRAQTCMCCISVTTATLLPYRIVQSYCSFALGQHCQQTTLRQALGSDPA